MKNIHTGMTENRPYRWPKKDGPTTRDLITGESAIPFRRDSTYGPFG
jgi:hypothetical protein